MVNCNGKEGWWTQRKEGGNDQLEIFNTMYIYTTYILVHRTLFKGGFKYYVRVLDVHKSSKCRG